MPRARLSIALAAVVLVASALTGCSGPPPDLQETTAAQLQSGVQTLTTAAAAGDFEAAQASLEAVQADLLTAAAADQVSAARAAKIQSALNLVSADLASAIEASKPEPTVAPAPIPSEEPTSVDKGSDKDNGKCKKKEDDCDDED
ncbi:MULTISPECIES: hypothetical protein [Cryobacterium]|uniref:Mucin-associated surface protein n=1 Tax=Cryobacterium breve TaxID=1259258 RepID=A0ABY2IW32_9MICO|nr:MULTISPECIES: hypothetical protein [Cryobacterium]TFC94625.1 hypothetical protein E3T20_07415 [Cryobacterium sp. TmT3-12]TFC95424.1 hypothetical protein E3O65_15435 [Cryobacterium breve]